VDHRRGVGPLATAGPAAVNGLFDTLVLGHALWLWLVFAGVVVTLLALDLGVLHRSDREIGIRESLWLSAGYISVALLFGGWLWWQLGAERGIEYFTGFVIEKSLSMDNVFVIAMIFSFFAIPRQ
jgi:tellurite resistance protein TerC